MNQQIDEQIDEQTDEQIQEDETEGPAGKKKRAILPAILAIPLVATAAFFLITKVVNPQFMSPELIQAADDQQDSSEDEEDGIICELGTVLANPIGVSARRIMKVGVSIEVGSKSLVEEVERMGTKLQHQLIVTLASKNLDELTSAQGKAALREELRKLFEAELSTEPGEIKQVYFTEFVIQ